MIPTLRIWAPLAFFAPIVISAQEGIDPVGWWRATTETPAGEVSTTLRLDYYDGELSGTFRNTFISAQLPIFDSVLEGNKVSFRLQLMTRLLQYEGEIEGDELTLSSRVIEGDPFPGAPEVTSITLTRSDNEGE